MHVIAISKQVENNSILGSFYLPKDEEGSFNIIFDSKEVKKDNGDFVSFSFDQINSEAVTTGKYIDGIPKYIIQMGCKLDYIIGTDEKGQKIIVSNNLTSGAKNYIYRGTFLERLKSFLSIL